jgi:threonine dehydrogenase-like Zn-dependent dehydrogenase
MARAANPPRNIAILRRDKVRAAVMHKAGDVRIENVPDAAIVEPSDAVIRVTRACICGSDLWPYNGGPNVEGQRMGHEAIGVVEDVGSEVQTIRRGQVVIMPFASSDGTCMFCDEGLPTPRGAQGGGATMTIRSVTETCGPRVLRFRAESAA